MDFVYKERILRIVVGILMLALFLAGDANATTLSIDNSNNESRYVWDAALGSNLTYTWTPMNFDWFFYDADNNVGNESLTIILDSNTSRNIQQNNLIYSTFPSTVSFKYKPFGNYNVMGFMGEKYFAGYTADSPGISAPISTINYNQLHKILIDDNTQRALYAGSTLTLSEGYVLKIKDLNVSQGLALLSLLKDGYEIDTTMVSAGNTYIYSKKIGTVSNLPIIALHVDTFFKGIETEAIFVQGLLQISENYTSVNTGDKYGIMEITDVSSNGIIMTNTNSISLTRDSTIDIMGNLKFRVADSEILRFYPTIIYNDPISYWRRGTVSSSSNNLTAWDALNFAGFWYDLNTGSYSESLRITNLSGRVIPEENLNYTTGGVQLTYVVTKEKGLNPEQTDGTYKAVGWGGDKQVAIKGKINKLSKIILEQGTSASEKKTLSVGETWDLGGGYTLTASSIDAKATPRQAWLTLNRDGFKIDDRIVSQGNIYTYVEKSLAGETDVPLFVTYLDSVFAGATTDMVQLRYTWLASSNATEIKTGDIYGVFSVTDIAPESIILKNNNVLELSTGSNITLTGTLNFTVADSPDLRFYPTKVFIIEPPQSGGGGGGECIGGGVIYSRGDPIYEVGIYLKRGWNLVSLPLVPLDSNNEENTSIQRITSNISDKIIKIVTYNASAMAQGKPPWEVYYPGDPTNSTLKELMTGKGYFIKMNESVTLDVFGTRVYENVPRSYPLTKGWNLIGYQSTSMLPVETALYNIQGNFSSIWKLDCYWKSYFGSEFYYMEPGKGYWIFMKTEGEVPQN